MCVKAALFYHFRLHYETMEVTHGLSLLFFSFQLIVIVRVLYSQPVLGGRSIHEKTIVNHIYSHVAKSHRKERRRAKEEEKPVQPRRCSVQT